MHKQTACSIHGASLNKCMNECQIAEHAKNTFHIHIAYSWLCRACKKNLPYLYHMFTALSQHTKSCIFLLVYFSVNLPPRICIQQPVQITGVLSDMVSYQCCVLALASSCKNIMTWAKLCLEMKGLVAVSFTWISSCSATFDPGSRLYFVFWAIRETRLTDWYLWWTKKHTRPVCFLQCNAKHAKVAGGQRWDGEVSYALHYITVVNIIAGLSVVVCLPNSGTASHIFY